MKYLPSLLTFCCWKIEICLGTKYPKSAIFMGKIDDLLGLRMLEGYPLARILQGLGEGYSVISVLQLFSDPCITLNVTKNEVFMKKLVYFSNASAAVKYLST